MQRSFLTTAGTVNSVLLSLRSRNFSRQSHSKIAFEAQIFASTAFTLLRVFAILSPKLGRGRDEMRERTNAIYTRIFSKDPFLLKDEHQEIFSGQILQNLLVERGIKSALPREVFL